MPPADGVEVVLVDQAAELAFAGRLVAVHVVQGTARIETGIETQLHTFGQPLAQPQPGTGSTPVKVAGRVARQRCGQAFGLGAGGAGLVGIEQ